MINHTSPCAVAASMLQWRHVTVVRRYVVYVLRRERSRIPAWPTPSRIGRALRSPYCIYLVQLLDLTCFPLGHDYGIRTLLPYSIAALCARPGQAMPISTAWLLGERRSTAAAHQGQVSSCACACGLVAPSGKFPTLRCTCSFPPPSPPPRSVPTHAANVCL